MAHPYQSFDSLNQSSFDYSLFPMCYINLSFLFPVFQKVPLMWSFPCHQETRYYHEVRFSSSFAGLASPPSQTARTPLDVYGFPLIIFTVLRMNQFMTFRAYHKSFPSPFAHKEYPLRIAL